MARSKALEFPQKTALNIIFPGHEYTTNLIIANVETLGHDDSYSHNVSSDSHECGGHGPLAPSGSVTVTASTTVKVQFCLSTSDKKVMFLYQFPCLSVHLFVSQFGQSLEIL